MLAYDTETTGLDTWHGCRPFFVATCDTDGMCRWWEWDVDPLTRNINVDSGDLQKINDLLCDNEVVMHNSRFDLRMTETLFPRGTCHWDFNAIQDTMVMGHCFRNLWRKGLKDSRQSYIFFPESGQDMVREAVKKARRICQSKKFLEKHGQWAIADVGHPYFPATKRAPKVGWWVMDMWLPAAICRHTPEFLPPKHECLHGWDDFLLHPWETVLRHYALEDALSTICLYECLHDCLTRDGLWEQYRERMDVLRVCYEMEIGGVNLLDSLEDEQELYADRQQEITQRLKSLAAKHGIRDFNHQSPKQISDILFNRWQVKSRKKTKGGQPSTDVEVLRSLADQHASGYVRQFCSDLLDLRKSMKSFDALTQYQQWSVPDATTEERRGRESSSASRDKPVHVKPANPNHRGVSREGEQDRVPGQARRIHATYNICGTKWTRQSSDSPNLQNVSTGIETEEEGDLDHQTRRVFGPEEGRIWVGFDYSNIELRIWAYDCGNQEFINAFKTGVSVHLIIARELHPELRDMTDADAQGTKAYKKTKNGDFSILYGASPAKANLTYGVRDAYNRLVNRFPEVGSYTKYLSGLVRKYGYIETLTGYRLHVPSEDPHKVVSARVQGTAGSIIGRAMVDVHKVLRPQDRLVLQVHDELVLDLPEDNWSSAVDRVQDVMQSQGDSIKIPLPVGYELYYENWAEGVKE